MKSGYFGNFGGRFVGETLIAPLQQFEEAYRAIAPTEAFQQEYQHLLKTFVGRPTALTYAKNISQHLGGVHVYLKREDLAHTGSHKINNALGQALLTKHMGKRRIIAETGAGQHGVATATVATLLGLKCVVYMGIKDMQRQHLNVVRMRMLGAEIRGVSSGSQTLKDAVSEALRDFASNVDDTHFLLGSAAGPHPYPTVVRDFQKIIGCEVRRQIIEATGRLPDLLVACVGGGSNAIGLFHPFLKDPEIRMVGVEAGGLGIASGKHAARFEGGSEGVFQGTRTFLLQDKHGQISETHSISAGLDYTGVGPEHAYLRDIQRVEYTSATDQEALEAARFLASHEGIIPALESAHAIAYLMKCKNKLKPNSIIVVNLSGRGDKDMDTFAKQLNF